MQDTYLSSAVLVQNRLIFLVSFSIFLLRIIMPMINKRSVRDNTSKNTSYTVRLMYSKTAASIRMAIKKWKRASESPYRTYRD